MGLTEIIKNNYPLYVVAYCHTERKDRPMEYKGIKKQFDGGNSPTYSCSCCETEYAVYVGLSKNSFRRKKFLTKKIEIA